MRLLKSTIYLTLSTVTAFGPESRTKLTSRHDLITNNHKYITPSKSLFHFDYYNSNLPRSNRNRDNTKLVFAASSSNQNATPDKTSWLNEIEDLTKNFEQIQQTIKNNTKLYDQTLTEYEQKIQILTQELSDFQNAKQHLESSVNTAQEEEMSLLKEDVKCKDEKILSLNETNMKLKIMIDELEKKGFDKSAIEKSLQNTEQALEMERQIWINEKDTLAMENQSAKEELEKITQKNMELRDMIDKLEKNSHDEKAIQESLRKTKEELENEKQVWVKEKENISKDRDAAISQLEKSINSLNKSSKDALEEKNNLILDITQKVKDMESLLIEKENTLKTQNSTLTEKEKIIEQITANVERFKVSSQRALKDKDDQIANITKSLDEAQAVVKEKENLISSLQTFVEEMGIIDLNDIGSDRTAPEVLLQRQYQLMKNTLEESLCSQKLLLEEIRYLKTSNAQSRYDLEQGKITSAELEDLKVKMENYEEERTSLRKLAALGFKRIGYIFRLRRKKTSE